MTDANNPERTGTYHPDDAADAGLDAGLAAAFRAGKRPSPERMSQSSRISVASGMPQVHLRDPEGEWVTPVNLPASGAMPAVAEVPDRYQLVGEIARGGMGAILKGRDVDLGRDIAVKVLLESHAGKTELLHRFVEEAQITGQLQHPGVVPVYELGQFPDQRPYFTMKLVKGQTLAALLDARTDPAQERSRWVGTFAQVCQTLAYAHARGVIHRDLKPSNVMVGAFGEVQVMDWGLAKVLAEGGIADEKKSQQRQELSVIRTARSDGSSQGDMPGSYTAAGSVLGTPAYMAPEQARGELELIDQRADVFGLGAILCEILTGKPPFQGKRAEAQRKAELAQLGPALARLDACGADAELVSMAKSCLAAEPWDRPRDAGQVAEAVMAYQHSVAERLHEAELAHAAEAARAEEAQAKARAERRSRRLTLALAVSVLLAGALGAAGWRWVELERIGRAAAVDARVNAAFQEALRLRGLAQGAVGGNLVPWAEAVAAAKSVDALLEPGVNPVLRQQAEVLLAEVTAEEQQAAAAVRAAERDRVLLDRLVNIRSGMTDDRNGEATDAAYTDAFRMAGIDVLALPPAEVGAQLRARQADVAVALAAALDAWAAVRRNERKDAAGAKRLTEAAQVADPDPWRRDLRAALEQLDKEARLTALRALARTARLDELGAVSLDLLGQGLNDAGDGLAAQAVLRAAQRRHPGDVWVNYDLARVLEKLDRREEAIRYYMVARALRPETAHELAHALEHQRETDEAIAVFQDLVRLRPKNGRHLACLGRTLQNVGRTQEAGTVLDAAVANLRETTRLEPEYTRAYRNLGQALRSQGKHDEAIATYRELIRLRPDDVLARNDISRTLQEQGKIDEAIAVSREVIRVRPGNAAAHNNLGALLCDFKHDYDAAIAAFRNVIRLEPKNASGHSNLGETLAHQGKFDEAIAAFRAAIQLSPDDASPHINLGYCLRSKGHYAEARASFQRGQELGAKPDRTTLQNRAWKASLQRGQELGSNPPKLGSHSLEWVRQVEQMIVLAPKFPELVQGQAQPADAAERFTLAQMCADREWYIAAARLWSEAFAQDPQRADDLQAEPRYLAACAAALASAGKAQDGPPPDEATKAQLRQQARAWLQADLAAYVKCLDGEDRQAPGLVRGRLVSWKYDPQLTSLRDEDALEKLPAEEREACRKLWAEVETVLKRAADK